MVLSNLLHAVLVDVEGCFGLWLVQAVQLSLLLEDGLGQLFVLKFAHAQRLCDVLPHLVLFEVALPLLDLELLLADLVQVLHHFALLAQVQVLLVHLLFYFELARFHILKLYLPCNKGGSCLALLVPIANVK